MWNSFAEKCIRNSKDSKFRLQVPPGRKKVELQQSFQVVISEEIVLKCHDGVTTKSIGGPVPLGLPTTLSIKQHSFTLAAFLLFKWSINHERVVPVSMRSHWRKHEKKKWKTCGKKNFLPSIIKICFPKGSTSISSKINQTVVREKTITTNTKRVFRDKRKSYFF